MRFFKKVSAEVGIARIEKELTGVEDAIDGLLRTGNYVDADLYGRRLGRIIRRMAATASWIRQSIDRV